MCYCGGPFDLLLKAGEGTVGHMIRYLTIFDTAVRAERTVCMMRIYIIYICNWCHFFFVMFFFFFPTQTAKQAVPKELEALAKQGGGRRGGGGGGFGGGGGRGGGGGGGGGGRGRQGGGIGSVVVEKIPVLLD